MCVCTHVQYVCAYMTYVYMFLCMPVCDHVWMFVCVWMFVRGGVEGGEVVCVCGAELS